MLEGRLLLKVHSFDHRLSRTDLVDQKQVLHDYVCISSVDMGGSDCHPTDILYNLK